MSTDTTDPMIIPRGTMPRLPDVPGGWEARTIDLGWRSIRLSIPRTPDLLLDLPEVQEANRRDDSMPYWATLWPAAETMASLLNHADWPAATKVLEIGCGLGLVGIAGLCKQWNVCMTDVDPLAVDASRYNAAMNGYPDAVTRILDWRSPPDHQYPVILACDVLYESRLHHPVLNVVSTMLARDGCCWIGDPGRMSAEMFPQTASERGFRVSIHVASEASCDAPQHGQFQVFELTRDL